MNPFFANILSKLQSRASVWIFTGLLTGMGIYSVYSINYLADLTHQFYQHPFTVSNEVT